MAKVGSQTRLVAAWLVGAKRCILVPWSGREIHPRRRRQGLSGDSADGTEVKPPVRMGLFSF